MEENAENIKLLEKYRDNQPDLWVSKNGKWHIYLQTNANPWNNYAIGVANYTNSDWPFKDYSGRVLYDNPYWIPKYVQDQVMRISKKITAFKGRAFNNPDFDIILGMLKE